MDLDRITELGFEKSSRWKTMVLVMSFSMWWNFFIMIQCYLTCILCTFALAYNIRRADILYVRYAIDLCYLLEVIFTLSYRLNPHMRKLRYTKGRGWFFIALDIISIIPFEWIYSFHIISDKKNAKVSLALTQNRLLRIYRVLQLESLYGIVVRKAGQYAFLLFLQITSKAILAAHFLCCIWVNMKHSVDCDWNRFNCYLWYETNMAILIIHNWSGEMEMFREPWERVLVAAAIFSGFILIFGHFYPHTLYACMQINRKRAVYYEKNGKLQSFLRNMVESPELKEKIQSYFNDVWKKDRADPNLRVLLKNTPTALQKEIFTDIYWEAFRHSELLRDVSRSCKRSLSLFMTTEYYQSGEVIYRKEQDKLKMMFLIQGIVQIMAEENEESPVLSFSSGTVFGELSLFLYTRSQAIVKCKSYCEFQILTMKVASSVLRGYPKDKKKIINNLQQRLTMARFTQWRKTKFSVDKKFQILAADLSNVAINDCVKWIKTQWRLVWKGHHRYTELVKAQEEGVRLPAWHGHVKPQVKIDFISNYLDLIVLSDVFEEKKDVVCLRMKFPWSIDPSAHFLRIWYYFIIALSFIPGLVYPLCTAWLSQFPRTVYLISYVITLIFEVDVIFKLLTAIKTKHTIITRFSEVFFQRLQNPTFYLDVLAAVPSQIYIILNVDVKTAPPHAIGLPLHPAILKSYVFICLKVPLSDWMDVIMVLKNCMIYFLLVYWFAELIQLLIVWDMIPLVTNGWITRFITQFSDTTKRKDVERIIRNYLVSIFRALVTAISIPDYIMYPDENVTLVCLCCAKYFFFFFFCFFLGDFYTVYIIKIFGEENFQVLLKRIKKFLESIFISMKVEKRLLRTVEFQWHYDKGDYLSSKVSVNKSLPFDLRNRVYSETTYKTLHSCKMFQEESMEFIVEVMENSFLVAVPSGSVLVSYGHTSHSISIIHKGYCQMNSFIKSDVSAGLGYPIFLGPCAMFPLLSSFCYVPAPVSVVTLTDCEVIMIDLDILLNIMIRHDFFKDVIDVVKEERLWEALQHIPAIMKLQKNTTAAEEQKEAYKNTFLQWGCCGRLLYVFCPKEKNLLTMKFYKVWDAFYMVYVVLTCWFWACCFGLWIYGSHIIVPALTAGKLITLLHIFFQFFAPYYNRKGLLVTHPIYTALNYLTSSFLLDLIYFCPIYPIYLYCFEDPYQTPNIFMIAINFAQHYVKLIHVMTYIKSVEDVVSNKHAIRMIRIVLILLLCANLFINTVMFVSATWIYGGPYEIVGFKLTTGFSPINKNLIRKNSLLDFYMFVTYWCLCSLTTTDYLLHQPVKVEELYFSYVQSFLGTIINFYLYAWLSCNSIFRNISGTIYKEKITSFVEYLKNEKAADRLTEYAIAHYNHEYSLAHEENLSKIFERLPIHLHEELVYPLYRPTLVKNAVFFQADEGFFKILSVRLTSVYFNRGSVIFFQNEAQSDIFIIHKGRCFVYDWFLMLEVGSIIGDIRQTGLMENKVYALTHVELLKISSSDFFTIINSFDDLEVQFTHMAKNTENFIKADTQATGYELRPVDSHDVLRAFGLQNKDTGFEDESYFEDPENSSSSFFKSWHYKQEEKLRLFIIYPGSFKLKFYLIMSSATAFFTLVIIPTFTVFGALTREAFIVVGVLDCFWFLHILANFLICYIDKVKGDVVTNFKFIAKHYAKRPNGLIVDILALIPFEFIPILAAKNLKETNAAAVAWLRIFRVLRGICIKEILQGNSRQLNYNFYIRYLEILLFVILWLTLLVNTYLHIATEPSIVKARDPNKLKSEQFFALVLAFEYVINLISSSNICVIVPDTMPQIIFSNVNVLACQYIKGWIIGKILSILYVNGVATSYYKTQVTILESYLKEKETSPSLIKEVLNYKMNLLRFSRSESMPSFLQKAPSSLRMAIMRDLYIQHLTNCPLFREVEQIFLDQLVARTRREIFFPGQKIVEQGDVDHCLYFIHSGEVYVINHTKEKAYVEYIVGTMVAGESFGEAQGLWFSIPHNRSFRARTLVQVIVLNSNNWMDLRRSFPEIATNIYSKAKALRLI